MVIAQLLAALGRRGPGGRPPLSPATSVPYPMVDLTAEEIGAADGVVIVTDHDAFDYELVRQHARYVLDTRNRLDGPSVERL